MKCGLLGRKLNHSYSPQIHKHLGDYSYELFEKEPEEVSDFLLRGDFSAINVTVPYKQTVIPFLDELSPLAQKLGAVNTIIRTDGKLIGHNTDFFGFLTMLRSSGLDVSGKKVLVLGSGGASHTAQAVLKELGSNVVIVSRSGDNNYENLHLHKDAAVIVNTTPVGMYPKNGVSPIDLGLFPDLEGVLDMIYNPTRTKLLLDAECRGIVAVNGLLMLVAQAKEAAEWFTGAHIEDDVIPRIHRLLCKQMKNLILIGMPGSGKTTVGKLVAEKLGRSFADADEETVCLAGKSIADIFAQDGEAVFRDWETAGLSKLGKASGLVISTGGGCVTRENNYPLLHQNGTIFCLNRELHQLPVDGRPLSQSNGPEELYRIRKPLYEAFADFMIDNNGDIHTATDQILRIWEEYDENSCTQRP